jgi:hypothetical protein
MNQIRNLHASGRFKKYSFISKQRFQRRVIQALSLLICYFMIATSHAMASNEVVEWAPFQLKPGISDEKLILAAQYVEDGFLKKQPGYIKRALLKGKKGQWVDIVYWKSEEQANLAASKAYESPICFEYFSLMKGAEQAEVSQVQHFNIIQQWH